MQSIDNEQAEGKCLTTIRSCLHRILEPYVDIYFLPGRIVLLFVVCRHVATEKF